MVEKTLLCVLNNNNYHFKKKDRIQNCFESYGIFFLTEFNKTHIKIKIADTFMEQGSIVVLRNTVLVSTLYQQPEPFGYIPQSLQQ